MATETPLSELRVGEGRLDTPSISEGSTDTEISLLDLLIVLGERKWMIFWITAVFAIVAILVSFLLPKVYTASVTVLPPQQNSSMAAAMASQQMGSMGGLGGMAVLAGAGLGLKNPNDMYVAMFKSRTVEDAMVKQFDLTRLYRVRLPSDARRAFEHHANVDGSGKDGLIHISIEDRDPNRAAMLANAYVDQFRKLSEHLAMTEASQRALFFAQQLEKAKDNLADSEEALKKTQQATGVIEPSGQAHALIAAAAQLRAQIIAKEVQIEGMQTYATGQNAQILQAQQELAGLRSQLARLGGSEDSPESELIVPKGKVPEAELEYLRKLRDVKYNEALFQILERQFEIAKLDEAKEGAVTQVVDQAIPPDRRSFPQRSLIVFGTTVLGFVLGCMFAFLQFGYQRMRNDRRSSWKLDHLIRLCSPLRWKPGAN